MHLNLRAETWMCFTAINPYHDYTHPFQSTPELLTAPLQLAARVTVFYGVVVLTGATAVGGLRQAPDGRGRPATEAQSVGGRHQGDRLARQEHQCTGRSLQSQR